MDFKNLKYLIVGSGISGCVLAERIAHECGERVMVIDKRDHIGGNCYSCDEPETGIHYHLYGTHIFHTDQPSTWDYISRFTDFNSYRHQVLTTYQNRVYQMPINLETINTFYGLNLRPFEVDDFLRAEIARDWPADIGRDPANFEEKAISLIGRPLYEAFIRGYTLKQWQMDPVLLPAAILQRLPFRKNYDESYYNDRWQGIPLHGYTAIFQKMLNHPKIEVHLSTDFYAIRNLISADTTVFYCGPIDQYFDFAHGPLEWRGLKFESEVVPYADYQGTSVMNYADPQTPFTRIHEPMHLHPERVKLKHRPDCSLIIREYSVKETGNANPFYPVNNQVNEERLKLYQERARQERQTVMLGRLGDYRYYDMNHAIERSLAIFQNHFQKVNVR